MIQPTNHNGIQTRDVNNVQAPEAVTPFKSAAGNNKNKNGILNIYEEHLKVNAPTYGEDIKEVMRKEKIEKSNLNAEIIRTMNKSGVNVTKDALNVIANQLQEEHLFNMFQNGYDIEKLTVDIIAKEIIRGETGPTSKKMNTDIGWALGQAGLPATNKNVQILSQYKDKIASIKQDSDVAVSNMIRHNSDATINNMYTAKHRGTPKDSDKPPTEEEIIAVLNMNGIKVTQANMNAARNLIGGSVEITKENVRNSISIQDTINTMDPDELIKKAAMEMKKGENPGDMIIGQEVTSETSDIGYDEIKQIVEDVQNIDETIIENTYSKDKPITIGNLQQTLHENVEKILKGTNEDLEKGPVIEMDQDMTEKVSTTKRQLEEIRLSLTLEAALKLNNKLDIQTADLTKVVEELKILEQQDNEEVLKNMGAPVTEENLEHMKQTSQRVYNISQNKEIAVVQVVQGEADFTLEGMDQAVQLKLAQDTYEGTGTKPEGRFGEGIRKVEDQIGHILDMNGIEATTANMKAAKALIQNNIDINGEVIEAAKGVLLKIETVLHELRPAVVAQILKEGIRPDTMPIDDLIQHIRGIQKGHNIDPNQKLAEAILELDKTNQLNTEERKGLIAVYRMLTTITKNETAAIGFLLDTSKEPTLGNLFEASKYLKKLGNKTGKMDVTVDDDLGIREGELLANIRSLIEEATSLPATSNNVDKWLNTKNIIDQWLSHITPEQLKSYVDMDKSLEELDLEEGELSPFEVERTTKQVEALEKISPHTLTFLKEHKIPLTIPNIYWTDKIVKNPYLLGDMLKDYEYLTGEKINTSINNSGHEENLEGVLDQLERELEEQSPNWLSASQSTQAYSIGKELEQMLSTQKQISHNEGMYQIPVQLHHGMSNLNVYVMKDKEQSNQVERDELKAYMSIKTKNLGVIQVNMRISDKAVAFEMIGETPEVTLGLQKGSQELKKAIEEIGYNVRQAKFSQGKPQTSLAEKPQASESLLKYRFEESQFEHII
ncbi:MAG TPA: hypothetical protein GX707_18665 [Epulopiscium sp.]|nr:hypothetical protein [Candidatus Epulonipiscium sp.]